MSTDRVILCPGQGAQAVGMGRGWAEASPAAKAIFDRADAVLGDRLGATLSSLCFDGPDERLQRTDVSQPAIYTCSVACFAGLGELGDASATGPVVAAAGLSLGEYTALHLAGAFDFETGLDLVTTRGRLMQEAAEASEGGMVAVIGASDEDAEALARDAAEDGVLVAANYNAPGQIVLSGDRAACDRAVALGAERGFRTTALAVAGAFHSPHMQPAADAMASVLAAASVQAPNIPVWSNVTAGPHDPGNVELLCDRLVQQIVSPVRWAQGCPSLPAGDTISLHEMAPGKVLTGLMRRIDRSRKVTNHDQPSARPSTA